MSLMSSFYTGVSGLNASQNSLNTTSHNLANVETKGYVRQQISQADRTYLRLGINHLTTLQVGLGADISSVRQVRDIFLDKSYRQEVGRQGFYEAQYEAVQEVEGMFGELEGVTFQDALEDLWASLQELSKDPSDVTRSSLIDSAVHFLDRANIISQQLNAYQVNLNKQITDKVDRINEIAESIDGLNKQISYYESNKVENANDLRDERNSLLDELGQIISITYKENADGTVSVSAEGVQLVTEDRTFKMGTAKVDPASDVIKPVWISHGDIDVFNLNRAPSMNNNTDIGSLKGLLVTRGSDAADYTDNFQREDFATLDEFEYAKSIYNNKTAPSIIMSVQAGFDTLIHRIVTAINDVLCPNKEVTLTDGSGITLKVFDEENAPAGMDADRTTGEALFNRKSVDRYREPTAYEIANSGGAITASSRIYVKEEPSDRNTLFTIGEIEINKEILENNSKLPINSRTGTQDYDRTKLDQLLTNWQASFASVSPDSTTKLNINDYYSALIGEVANRGEQYSAMSTHQATMVNSIDNQRQETSGVSSDEELTNLIKFQHAYNASARYITVISEMLEHIVTRL